MTHLHNYRLLQACFVAIVLLAWIVAFQFCDLLITTSLYRQYQAEAISEKTLNVSLQKRMLDEYGVSLVRLEEGR